MSLGRSKGLRDGPHRGASLGPDRRVSTCARVGRPRVRRCAPDPGRVMAALKDGVIKRGGSWSYVIRGHRLPRDQQPPLGRAASPRKGPRRRPEPTPESQPGVDCLRRQRQHHRRAIPASMARFACPGSRALDARWLRVPDWEVRHPEAGQDAFADGASVGAETCIGRFWLRVVRVAGRCRCGRFSLCTRRCGRRKVTRC